MLDCFFSLQPLQFITLIWGGSIRMEALQCDFCLQGFWGPEMRYQLQATITRLEGTKTHRAQLSPELSTISSHYNSLASVSTAHLRKPCLLPPMTGPVIWIRALLLPLCFLICLKLLTRFCTINSCQSLPK